MQTYSSKYLLLLLVFCVLVLLISIVGVSFAINYLEGYDKIYHSSAGNNIILKYENNKNELSYDELLVDSDAFGMTSERYRIKFTVVSDASVKYTLGASLSNPECLKNRNIKVALLDEEGNVLVGKKEKSIREGISLNHFDNNLNDYYFFSDEITSFNNIKNYTFIAYINRNTSNNKGVLKAINSKNCRDNGNVKLKIIPDDIKK